MQKTKTCGYSTIESKYNILQIMLLTVSKLSKQYGEHQAISELSFSIQKGEIVGFLGSNGAGKTTTMRILAGCIGASSGHCSLNGLDITQHPLEVKKEIGYLPEVPPLYPQMKVYDYLHFAAELRDVADPSKAVQATLKRLGLWELQHRFIDQLSKGYRQRLGLAQALVHEPSLILLDEPTNGLDPSQRHELRELLRSLANNGHTIVLSTHILSEIEELCSRVLIIKKGHLIAEHELLNTEEQRMLVEILRPSEEFEEEIRALNYTIESIQNNCYEIQCKDNNREDIARIASKYGLRSFTPCKKLETIYLSAMSSEL